MMAATVIGFLAAAWAAIGNFFNITEADVLNAGLYAFLGAVLMDIWKDA